ncbi:MAG: UDP-3-O-[3-hydroxymyristoyl] N-acetylglucosamine deacetylase [Candidatus Nealsonbacteria bacterium]|nr:UDP-3-O-[3-hydroxymyristoyl] N-acetylglucosamine deacetylase [Candidatus Nealsonbacteria bacterium]
MEATRNQRTIGRPASIEGIGYWSGHDVRVEFCPADPDTGIVFVRTDLKDRPRIPATIENRTETPLRTTLQCGDAGVDMIEHVMASLAGLQVDNCEVRVDRQEMPGCDGSSLPMVEALDAAGLVEQDAPREQRIVRETVRLGDRKSWIEISPSASAETILQCKLDYGRDTAIGRQKFCLALSPETFRRELAPSRTFLLEHEAAALRDQGLGQRATFQDLLVFGPDGPIDNRLRFPDECVRHKLLDMVGDLALAGCDLIGRFVAYRGGHRLNAEAVRAILARAETQEVLQRCA